MKSKPIDPKESLEIIQQMIAASRQQFAEKGAYMILWGIMMIVASTANFLIFSLDLENSVRSNWIAGIWIGFPIIAGVISYVIGSRMAKKCTIKTHIGSLLQKMWIGYSINLFLIVFFTIQAEISPIPYILALTGFATSIFGLGVRYKAFIIGGLCFFIFAVLAFWISLYPDFVKYQLLIFALAIAIGYLIPGVMLYKKVNSSKA